jgi:lipid-binding SYLF domain-containing protein
MKITLAPFAKPKVVLVALFCAIAFTAQASDDKAKQQKQVQEISNKTLQQLYEAQPAAKAAVQHAAGYALFNNMGVKILFAGSGKGKGIAVSNKTKKETFMKMVELQAGLGVGVEKFANVFVFENDKVLSDFINSGWEFGGQASAAAKTTTKGGAMAGAASVSEGVWMYQLTEKGLAAEIAATGTKYYKDDDLN